MTESDLHSLPAETLPERLSRLKQQLLFNWIPGGAYARLRSWRYTHFKDPEMQALPLLVARDRTSVDVGANLGLFTLPLARYSTTVHAFEPNPGPYALLKTFAPRNAVVRHMAVGDASGEVEFCVPRTRRGWSSNGGHIGSEARSERDHILRIPCVRLDDIDLGDVGFIKIDVEGHELGVLRGASGLIDRCRPTLFIETERSHVGDAAAQVLDMLGQMDYDGFFVARGVLTHLSHFSFEQFQLRPRQQPALGLPYVKNFIFLPRKPAG